MATSAFSYEIEESKDERHRRITTIKCHGQLRSENVSELKELVKPLIAAEAGIRIVIDCADLESLDSSGLGALVGLKVSALNRGLCTLELANVSPRVRDLLKLTHLTELFSK